MDFKMARAVKLCVSIIIMMLGGCGFKPMYGNHSEASNNLAQILANIHIDNISNSSGRLERLSQQLRSNLSDRISPLNSEGTASYILNANYEVEERGYGIREDESVTLQNLRLTVAYQLLDVASEEPVLESTARAIVTYDLVQSDFSNKAARDTSLERLSEEVANQIVTRIGSFLSNNQMSETN